MTQRLDFSLKIVASLILASVCSGCGGDGTGSKCSVSGMVTFDGQPIEDGRITFTPTGNKGTIAGAPIKAGAYTIPATAGPEPGDHKVEIHAMRKTGKQIEAVMPAPAGTMIDITEDYIPQQYNAKSTLKFDVKPGDNKADFTLTK